LLTRYPRRSARHRAVGKKEERTVLLGRRLEIPVAPLPHDVGATARLDFVENLDEPRLAEETEQLSVQLEQGDASEQRVQGSERAGIVGRRQTLCTPQRFSNQS
jgi:hypothetical protein